MEIKAKYFSLSFSGIIMRFEILKCKSSILYGTAHVYFMSLKYDASLVRIIKYIKSIINN